jgi:anti-sigma regulatory factor (Ser/Thr protein kinase)
VPYYRCHACALTVHSAAGRFSANLCPNCSELLTADDRIYVEEHHPAAITRRFPAQRSSVAAARRELERLLWALDAVEHATLALLVSEVIGNSVKHSGARAGSVIRLDVVLTQTVARVEVRDEGHGFVPAARDASSPLESQWGLDLLQRMADRWGVEADPHTLVWFEVDRAGSTALHEVQPTTGGGGRVYPPPPAGSKAV